MLGESSKFIGLLILWQKPTPAVARQAAHFVVAAKHFIKSGKIVTIKVVVILYLYNKK